jgi:hypothetical protein
MKYYGYVDIYIYTVYNIVAGLHTLLIISPWSTDDHRRKLRKSEKLHGLVHTSSWEKNGDLLLLNGTSTCDLMDCEWDIRYTLW